MIGSAIGFGALCDSGPLVSLSGLAQQSGGLVSFRCIGACVIDRGAGCLFATTQLFERVGRP